MTTHIHVHIGTRDQVEKDVQRRQKLRSSISSMVSSILSDANTGYARAKDYGSPEEAEKFSKVSNLTREFSSKVLSILG